MAPVMEDSIILNPHLIGLIITGTLMGTVVFFGMFYYLYVKRSRIYLNASIYFLGIFIRLTATAFLDLKGIMGLMLGVDLAQITYLHLLGGLLAIYMSIYLISFFIQDGAAFHKHFGVFLMIFMMLGLRGIYEDALLMWYFTLMYLGSYFLLKLMEFIGKRGQVPVKERYLTFSLVMIIVIAQVGVNSYSEAYMHYEWLTISFMSLLLLVFFLWDYKRIFTQRDGMYLKLIFDGDTKCYSKNYILEQYEKTPEGTVIFMDFNHFKWVNDTFGHVVGDRLVQGFTTRLAEHLTPKMLLGRFGGDEFILLTENGDVRSAARFSKLIVSEFMAVAEENGLANDHRVGISIGIASFDNRKRDAIHLADHAMYTSKQKGNNQVTIAGGDSHA